jgi:hypothetical protein
MSDQPQFSSQDRLEIDTVLRPVIEAILDELSDSSGPRDMFEKYLPVIRTIAEAGADPYALEDDELVVASENILKSGHFA